MLDIPAWGYEGTDSVGNAYRQHCERRLEELRLACGIFAWDISSSQKLNFFLSNISQGVMKMKTLDVRPVFM